MSREIDNIRVEFIESLPGRRPVNEETVVRLMESIRRIGLRTPLSVRLVDGFDAGDGEIVDGQPVLVTGAHRLEAVRRLGWERVECFVLSDETEAQARMWEIAENLHRAELTELERSEHVAEWIAIAEQAAAEAEAARQKDGRVAGKKSCQSDTKRGRPKSGVNQASRELIIPGKTDEARRLNAHRAVKVASLTPEAKEAAREVGLDDNRSALLAAAKAEPQQQAEVIRKIADEKAKRALLKPAKAPTITSLVKEAVSLPEWTAEHEAAFAALCDAWEAAPHEARVQFLQQLPSRYRLEGCR